MNCSPGNAAPPSIPGHQVELLATVDSTNAEARRRLLAGRARPGLVLLAEKQTAGRGRRGRSWHCVPGRSLAATLIVATPPLPRISRITLLASVAAARALEANGSAPIAIKWPNDLMRGERKLAGMLVEQLSDDDGNSQLLIGLGINLALSPGDLPAELAELATDAGLDPSPATRNAVLRDFVLGVDGALADLGTDAAADWAAEYCRRSWLDGRRVELLWEGREQLVEIARITEEGDLLLADGRMLRGEHVQLLSLRADR